MSLPAVSFPQAARSQAGLAEVNGTRLYYQLHGAGPPLLLLHGFGFDRRVWRPQLERLSRQHLVISYDARGFGRSATPGGKPYRHFEDAAALCQYLEVGPVLAVGHSLGAHQLLELSLARPGLVSGLVMVCPTGLFGLAMPPDMARLARDPQVTARTSGVSSAKRLWAASPWLRPARDSAGVRVACDEMLADYSGWHWTHGGAERGLDTPAALQLDCVRAPSLVITGGRDVAYHDAVARALVRGIPDAQALVLPDAGHLAPLEDPDAVSGAILNFARDAPPASGNPASGFF